MIKFTLRTLLILWPVASFILSAIEVLLDRGQQWDLRNYLEGLRAFRAGLNPYVDASFIYPPVFLPLLDRLTRPFTADQLYVGLLALKVVGVVALVTVWRRHLVRRLPLHLFLPVVWLGFFASIAIDLYAGNVSTFETLLLSLGFACFAGGRLYLTAVFVTLAATPKLLPIVFLGALLTQPGGLRPFLAGAGAFWFYLGFNYGLYPRFARDFVTQAWSRTGEARLINPSSLAFIKEALPSRAAWAAAPLWLVFAAAVLTLSWRAWRRRADRPRLDLVLFLALVYVVAAPRVKDYAYMIALPSVMFALQSVRPRRPEWLLPLPLLLHTKNSAPVLFETPFALLWNYYPFAVALAFWALLIHDTPAVDPRPASTG